jgi:hypothetical protein
MMQRFGALALSLTLIGLALPACSDESEPGGVAGNGGTVNDTM